MIPSGWVGEVHAEMVPLPSARTTSTDLAEVMASPLYRAVPPELLLDGLELVAGEVGTAGVVLRYRATTNERLSLRVTRLLLRTRPENRTVSGGTRTLVVDGRYALVNDVYPPGPVAGLGSDSAFRPYSIIVTMGAGELVTTVHGTGYDEPTLIAIAKAMVP